MVKTYSNRTRKALVVVAYDIVSDKRRNKMVKFLEQYGKRINYSVFECLVLKSQLKSFIMQVDQLILPECDQVVCYHVCVDCYSKTNYFPSPKTPSSVAVVL